MAAYPEIEIRDAPALGPGAKRFRFECPHGSTSAAVVPGRQARAELVAVVVLMARHDRENGCRCSRELRPRFPGLAFA